MPFWVSHLHHAQPGRPVYRPPAGAAAGLPPAGQWV